MFANQAKPESDFFVAPHPVIALLIPYGLLLTFSSALFPENIPSFVPLGDFAKYLGDYILRLERLEILRMILLLLFYVLTTSLLSFINLTNVSLTFPRKYKRSLKSRERMDESP